ncbi:MAG TPA: Ig-like domain repeat protein, partial [Gemmataceae bacterium]|nr:Ig-like domain repeat protein [Gemmataceae bacterium]
GTVPMGTTVVLTANNVTDSASTQISDVTFYRETNGVPGLQIGSDTLLGTGTQYGTSWSVSVLTTALSANAYTFYAFATNVLNVSSATLAAPLVVTQPHSAISIASWNMLGQGAFGTQDLPASTMAAQISNSLGLTRGDGVSTANSQTAKANAWGGANWADTSEDGIDNDQYITFGLTVGAGETLSLTNISLNYRRTAGFGPDSGYWEYQINGGDWDLIADVPGEFPSNNSAGAAMTPLSLTTIGDLQYMAPGTNVLIRLVPYDATGATSTFYIYHKTTSDLVVAGSIVPASSVTITDVGPAPTLVGQPATFNVHVSPFSPTGPTPTGIVALEDVDNNDAIVGSGTLSAGVATISSSILADGLHHVIAVYTGDANNSVSQSDPVVHDVVYATATTLTASVASIAFGQTETLTATVAAPAAGATGTVQFLDGTSVLGIVNIDSDGIAALDVSNLGGGSHSITAIYSGDSNFGGSASTATVVTVAAASTSTSVQSSEPSANIGDDVTFTAQVATIAPGVGIATGTVQFTVDGVALGAPLPLDVSGMASLTVADLAVGPHMVAAIYNGNSNFAGSTSDSISQTIVAGPIQVKSVVVNGDHLDPVVSQQRSEVTSILYTFNQPVMLSSDSFTIALTEGQTGTVPTLVVAPLAGSGNTKWLVTFSGAGVNGGTGSIADGVYDITLVGANVLAGVVPMANDRADTFFRLMGDLDGNANVNNSDFSQLAGAFLTSAGTRGFIAGADLDGDGTIGTSDFAQFVSNFLNSFTGFSATI